MAHEVKSPDDFWNDPYIRELSPKAKLAFYYALGQEYQSKTIILEDMAGATGIEMSECGDWLEQFITDKVLEEETVYGVSK